MSTNHALSSAKRVRSIQIVRALRASAALVTAIAFVFSSVGDAPYSTAYGTERESIRRTHFRNGQNDTAPKAGRIAALPLVAPLFLENDTFNSTLILVNASKQDSFATVTVRSFDGQIVGQQHIPLAPSNQTIVRVTDLLRESGSTESRGSIIVEQDPDLTGVAVLAQLSIVHQSYRTSYLDEELAQPNAAAGSRILRGVTRGGGSSPLIAVTSMSPKEQEIRLDCLAGHGAIAAKKVTLAPYATALLSACRRTDSDTQPSSNLPELEISDELNSSDALAMQITSNAGPGQFAAFGITRHRTSEGVAFGTVAFSDPKLTISSTTIFAGIPVGQTDLLGARSYKPYVAVANFSWRRTNVSVSLSKTSDSSGPAKASLVDIRDVSLEPQEAKLFEFGDLEGDPEVRNSFVVTSDALPGEVVATVASRSADDESEVELLAKDAEQNENTGSHPWSLDSGNDSTLLVFNHTDQVQPVVVTIANGTQLWQKILKLSPVETLALSIRRLIEKRIADDRGRTLPPGLVNGEIFWTMAKSHTTTGRLLVSNKINGMARNFSCFNYTVLCGASMSPGSATTSVSGSASFGTTANACLAYSDSSCSGPSTSGGIYPSYSWSNNSTGYVDTSSCGNSSGCYAYGRAPGGSATVDVLVQTSYCTFGASSNLTVYPVSFNISVSSTPIAGESNSVISSQSAQVTVTAKANGSTASNYIGTVHFSSTDTGATLPSDYSFQYADGGTHTFNVTLKSVAGTSATRDLTVTDNASGESSTQNIYVWFQVQMDVEFWKNCCFLACPNLGSYFCQTAYTSGGYSQPTAFVALTNSSISLKNQSVTVRSGSGRATAFVGDAGPVLNQPYWNTGNAPPAIAGCVSELLYQNLGLGNLGCTSSGCPNACTGSACSNGAGGGSSVNVVNPGVLWRFGT